MGTSKINVLEDVVVSKIAAGEVIERPASVVKELVENSIDAGGDSIEVEILSAGSTLIRVADNGEGMSPEDAEVACVRHATSKIRDISDIEDINTLGFRGEGLSSIAAVSQMDLISCRGSDGKGIYLYLENGQVQKKRPAGRSRGTTVEARNLFYNVPARKKFLRQASTELAEIVNVVSRFILSHPDIEFKLAHGDRTLLFAAKGMGLTERIGLVLGGDVRDGMIEVRGGSGRHGVRGFVSRPANTRKDRNSQVFFVNSRYVKSRLLSDAVYGSYRSMLERGRYPAAVLFIDVPKDEIDVNVHPTKLLVKFDDERSVRTDISGAIKSRFDEIKTEGAPAAPVADSSGEDGERPGLTAQEAVQDEFEYSSEKESGLRPQTAREPVAVPVEVASAPDRDTFQVGDCYIVQFGENGLTVTDQHAAHERVLYEFFSGVAQENPVDTQNLLFPVKLELSAGDAVIMEKVADRFSSLGFQVEHFGDRSYVVQTVPAILKDSDIKAVIYDILSDLSSADLKKTDITEELIKLTSCRAAIKAGDPLTRGEMLSLLEQLKRCELPFTCPHGRPTVLEITVDELEKRFRRK